jgi:hypothetical protein
LTGEELIRLKQRTNPENGNASPAARHESDRHEE